MASSEFAGALPEAAAVVVFRHFSTAMLVLSCLLAPLFFGVVLTRSGQLGNFKWLLLNQSVWSLALQCIMCVAKPVFLGGAPAGYMVGAFRGWRNADASLTDFLLVFDLAACSGCGLVMSLVGRYLAVFPGPLQRFAQSTHFYVLFVLVHIPFLALVCVVLVVMAPQTEDTMLAEARKAMGDAVEPFLAEGTFLYVASPAVDTAALCSGVGMLAFVAILVGVSTYFMHAVRQHKGGPAGSTNHQLCLTSFVQVTLASTLLFAPMIALMFAIHLRVPNSGAPIAVMMTLLTVHCPVNFVSTLLLVSPYRRFLTQRASKLLRTPSS